MSTAINTNWESWFCSPNIIPCVHAPYVEFYITDVPVIVPDAVAYMSNEQMDEEFALIEKLLSR